MFDVIRHQRHRDIPTVNLASLLLDRLRLVAYIPREINSATFYKAACISDLFTKWETISFLLSKCIQR